MIRFVGFNGKAILRGADIEGIDVVMLHGRFRNVYF
jgi:hypothetical protein